MSESPKIENSDPKSLGGKELLKSWLNKSMKIVLSDGRVLVGTFLCTDSNANVILGSCTETSDELDSEKNEEPRVLGLAMIPGRHIVSVHVDQV